MVAGAGFADRDADADVQPLDWFLFPLFSRFIAGGKRDERDDGVFRVFDELLRVRARRDVPR
jgi:hypothetical protein